jgi:hypothetical protein
MEFIDKKYVELINKEIDHIITPDEKEKLDIYLSDNKAAQDYYNGLLKANDYLSQLPDQEPSENLKKQIINSIDSSRYSPKTKKQNSWGPLFAPKFKFAYTFAAGLILGIIIYAMLINNSNTVNINDVYGTIGISNGANTIAELPLKFSDISGKIDIKSAGKNFWFNLDLNSTNKFDVVISYPEGVKFENFRLGIAKNIEVSKGQSFIKITNSGPQQFSMLFSQVSLAPTTVKIEILQAGNILYEHDQLINE